MAGLVAGPERLGRVAGMGVAAGIMFALGAIFLAVALALVVVHLLPEGDLWKALAYLISTLALAGVAGLIVWRATR